MQSLLFVGHSDVVSYSNVVLCPLSRTDSLQFLVLCRHFSVKAIWSNIKTNIKFGADKKTKKVRYKFQMLWFDKKRTSQRETTKETMPIHSTVKLTNGQSKLSGKKLEQRPKMSNNDRWPVQPEQLVIFSMKSLEAKNFNKKLRIKQ